MLQIDPDFAAQLDTETRSHSAVMSATGRCTVPGLTILWHPDPRRVGERLALTGLASGRQVELSRRRPDFSPPGRALLRPLADPHLSRRPLRFSPGSAAGSVRLLRHPSPTRLVVDGEPVDGDRELGAAEVARGVVLLLARHVVLLLHEVDPISSVTEEDFDLVGESPAMGKLRSDVRRMADLDVPVLLCGESGTGKELVARAIHQAGHRRDAPLVAVNMAAVPPSLASSELFGAVKGAFTGADHHRLGYFARADGGTLFLDEIGETPLEVQSLLLRALETREVRPVGADEVRRVDVRLIAATDRDLTAAAAAGELREPLLHRLSGYEIHIPPLRQRREDFGRLFACFVFRELQHIGKPHRLEPDPEGLPWMPAELVARLAAYDWPGNVRQLKNVARQLVIAGQDEEHVSMRPELESMLARAGPATHPEHTRNDAGSGATRRRASDIHQGELLAVLRAHRWRIQPAARELRISRPALYDLIDKNPRIKKAVDLSREEIEDSLTRCGGNVNEMVDLLEVSERGLLRRMKQLGLR